MKNKPGSPGSPSGSARRTSTSKSPRRAGTRTTTRSASEGASPAAGAPRESWRTRTGQTARPSSRVRSGDRRRAPKPRPVRVPGVLSRPSIDELQLTQDFEQMLLVTSGAGLELQEAERSGLWNYGRFLVARAGTLNLISQVDRGRFFNRHMLECLVPGLVAHARKARELVDIGSGGGLPGLPLALVSPELQVTLIEPRQRKVQFLEAAILECGLSARVRVFQGTADRFAEELKGNPTADLATARAVDRLEKVWGWARRLLIPGGWVATYKGPGEIEDELRRLKDGAPSAIETFPCPGQPRAVLLIQNPRD